ncbi:glycosyltransferase [Streptomyces sp. NPDC021093]|uniref:glycosyltransferase n=1 Tax=Streptomyces sp. NPDC021093 TaxID=3365112 RepID=UPI0037A36510
MTSEPDPPVDLSIVVPTFNEAENIGELLRRLASAFAHSPLTTEVIFADDSTDGTCEVIERAAPGCPLTVVLHHREVPAAGLGGAVVEGIGRARAPWIVVIDADLQHPPELIPELIARGESSGAELVVASRYAAGGSRPGLAGGYRLVVSGASTLLTKALFPRALRGLSDPMSGFFAIRREAVDSSAAGGLQPLGYKILLELAVRCRPRGIAEVPYAFGERHAGESKSTVREGLRFLRHLVTLRTADPRARMVVFGLIGLSGFVPNLALLWVLNGSGGMHYAPAEIIANQAGLLWNFLLVDAFLYRTQRGERRWPARLLSFAAVGNADLLARIPLTALLVTTASLAPVAATALSMVLVFAGRFLVVDRWLYGRRRGASTGLPDRAEERVPDPAG